MKKIVLFLTFIGGTLSSFAQWYAVNSNTTENLKDIIMLDDNIGYAVGGGNIHGEPNGGDGVILKTIDGGENWTLAFSQENTPISSIGFIGNNIYTFAKTPSENKLLISEDDGNTWSLSTVPYRGIKAISSNASIYFLNKTDKSLKKMSNVNSIETIAEEVVTFGVNGNVITYIPLNFDRVYKSIDDGENFEELESFPENLNSSQTAWSVVKSFNNNIIIHCTYPSTTCYSDDNGATWTSSTDNEFGANYCEIISSNLLMGEFNRNLNYKIVSESWENQTELSEQIRKIYVYNENLAFAVGDNGMIYKTTNVEGLASNPQHTTKSGVKIVPNPSSNTLLLTNTEHLNIQSLVLYDTSGKKVKEYQTNTQEMDVSTLSSGTYLLRISTPKGTYTEKVVKN